jgi:tetratricopeptide (TPR) repeat protein
LVWWSSTPGNSDKAEDLLVKAVRQRLESAPAWLTLGMIDMDRNQPDAALAALSQAMLLDPKNARTRNFLGVVMGRRGWIDAAQEELRRAVRTGSLLRRRPLTISPFFTLRKNLPPSSLPDGITKKPSNSGLKKIPAWKTCLTHQRKNHNFLI